MRTSTGLKAIGELNKILGRIEGGVDLYDDLCAWADNLILDAAAAAEEAVKRVFE